MVAEGAESRDSIGVVAEGVESRDPISVVAEGAERAVIPLAEGAALGVPCAWSTSLASAEH